MKKKKNCNCEFCPVKEKEDVQKYQIKTTEELLELMDIYLSEWKHRDILLWRQIFTFFFVIMLVYFFPYFANWGENLIDILPGWICLIIGIVLSILFLFVGIGYSTRLKASGNSYQKIIDKLPTQFQRVKIDELNNFKIANSPMSSFIVSVMFVILLVLGIALLVINIK